MTNVCCNFGIRKRLYIYDCNGHGIIRTTCIGTVVNYHRRLVRYRLMIRGYYNSMTLPMQLDMMGLQ